MSNQGDFNDDGFVDIKDLNILLDNWGATNGDVTYDQTSLDNLVNNWNTTLTQSDVKQLVVQYKVDNIDLTTFGETEKTTMQNNVKTSIAQQLGIPEYRVTVELVAGSVIFKVTIEASDSETESLKQNIVSNKDTISNNVLTTVQTVTDDNSATLDAAYGGVVTEQGSSGEMVALETSWFDGVDNYAALFKDGTVLAWGYEGEGVGEGEGVEKSEDYLLWKMLFKIPLTVCFP